MPRFQGILFPVDFSERSRAAAPFVLSMAQRYSAPVVALHVLQPPPPIYGGMNTVYPDAYDLTGVTEDLRRELVKFAEDMLKRLRPVISLPVVSGPLTQLSRLLGPMFGPGTEPAV